MEPSSDAETGIELCDREPIHTPGNIQPHGHLLVACARSGEILQVAGDDSLLNGPVSAALGQPLGAIIGRDQAELVQSAPLHHGEPTYFGRLSLSELSPQLNMFAHRHEDRLLIEFEQAPEAALAHHRLLGRTRASSARISGETSLSGACRAAAEEVRSLLGYDRVMVYRFLEDGTGMVIAENLKENTRPFLNHRFPASDIPAQARELYVRNLVRVIPDTEYTPAPVLALSSAESEQLLDMSYSTLRGISPVHIQYMKNMGVRASASISIVRHGKLWGLIACHHFSPRQIGWELRETCKHLAQVLAGRIRGEEEAERHSRSVVLGAVSEKLLSGLRQQIDVDRALGAQVQDLPALFECDGAAVVAGETVNTCGLSPAPDAILALTDWVLKSQRERCFATHDLLGAFPPAKNFGVKVGGLMSLVIDAELPVVLFWFRAEELQIIEWAGNPHKGVPASSALPLSPRQSFETWREEVGGYSATWSKGDCEGAEIFASSLRHVRASSQLARLNGELVAALANEREALEEIRLLQANLMQAGRRSAMATMASTLAHEVNQPLLAISNYVSAARQLLANPADPDLDQIRTALEAAGDSIKKVAAIVRNMRRTLGPQQTALQEADLSQVTKQALSLALSSETAPGVGYEVELQEGLHVKVDPVQIQQVVLNLVGNALDAMADTPRRVLAISTYAVGQEAFLTVSDSGSGLGEEAWGRLFEAFYSTKPGRLGTGLAVCRTIVEAHGGRIRAEQNDEGSTFLISLPLAQPPARHSRGSPPSG